MNTVALSFPPMPAGADKKIIKPSASFNKRVYSAIAAILLFVFTYLCMLAGAVAIAIVFGAIGLAVIGKAGFMSLVLGVGLIIAGLMLVFFVIKFLFKRTREDRSDMIEISEAEQPELFAFIKQITREVKAPAPKRIYITADVNAGVFYNSSFWSMFFPVKKNLKIGLGLVNSLNISEFKAVMAHEFGHFSQRSMKFGSYVYNLNKVIYNMLYDNEGYGKILSGWSKIHSIFTLMASINVKIIQGMQYVLRKVYIVLNKNYMGLSREMEFHADAVAAYVSGSNHLITSLKRTEIGQMCYTQLLDYWNQKLQDKKRADNFYPQQLEMIQLFAQQRLMPIDNGGLPQIIKGTAITENSEIVIDDQWSSHPSTEDRELYLNRIALLTDTQTQPAWVLFNNAEALQVMLTNHLYVSVPGSQNAEVVDLEGFKNDFSKHVQSRLLDKRYKNYYDYRNINAFDVDEAIATALGTSAITFEKLFADANTSLPRIVERMQSDMGILNGLVADTESDIKTFDYKGTKYQKSDIAEVQNLITAEREAAVNRIQQLDKEAFIFFYNAAETEEQRNSLKEKYQELFNYQAESEKHYERYNIMAELLNSLYTTMPFKEIKETVDVIYENENELKPIIAELVADNGIKQYISAEQTEHIANYISAQMVYFRNPEYDNAALAIFSKGIDAYISIVSKSILQ